MVPWVRPRVLRLARCCSVRICTTCTPNSPSIAVQIWPLVACGSAWKVYSLSARPLGVTAAYAADDFSVTRGRTTALKRSAIALVLLLGRRLGGGLLLGRRPFGLGLRCRLPPHRRRGPLLPPGRFAL